MGHKDTNLCLFNPIFNPIICMSVIKTQICRTSPPRSANLCGHIIFDIYIHLPPQRAVPCHGEEPHAAAARRRRTPPPLPLSHAAAPRRRSPPPPPPPPPPHTTAARRTPPPPPPDAFADEDGETASATSPPWAPPVMAYTTASDTPLIG